MYDFDQPGFPHEPKKQEPINNLKKVLSKSILEQEIKERYGQETKKVTQEAHEKEHDLQDKVGHDEYSEHKEHHPKNSFKLVFDHSVFDNRNVTNLLGEYTHHLKGRVEFMAAFHALNKKKETLTEIHQESSVTLGPGLVYVFPKKKGFQATLGGFAGVSVVKSSTKEKKDLHGIPKILPKNFSRISEDPIHKGDTEHTKVGFETGVAFTGEGPNGLRIEGEAELPTDKYWWLHLSQPFLRDKFAATVTSDTNVPLAIGGSWRLTRGLETYLEFIPKGPNAGNGARGGLRWVIHGK